MAQIQERFARIARHNPERLPAAPKPALEPRIARSVPYDEPSNEELGIKPDGRPLLAYLLLVAVLAVYGIWAMLR